MGGGDGESNSYSMLSNTCCMFVQSMESTICCYCYGIEFFLYFALLFNFKCLDSQSNLALFNSISTRKEMTDEIWPKKLNNQYTPQCRENESCFHYLCLQVLHMPLTSQKDFYIFLFTSSKKKRKSPEKGVNMIKGVNQCLGCYSQRLADNQKLVYSWGKYMNPSLYIIKN